jgi:hypothetical protein
VKKLFKMNIEEKVKMNLLTRGFDNKTQLNNRGLIGATIEETILEVVKNLRIHDVVGQSEQFISLNRELIDVGIINEDDIEVESWVNNYLKEIN